MKNILLPTDFSDNSWNAIEYALNFYQDTVCNFYLLHINRINIIMTNDTPYIPNNKTVEDTFLKASKHNLRKLSKRIIKDLPQNKKHKIYTLTDYSLFIDGIRKHVKQKRIDVIVMGTKGASGLKEYLIGSNTGDVITKVSCTTLVVPEEAKYTRLKEIAFPTDYILSYDTKILETITEVIEKESSSLRILHINKKDTLLNLDQQNNKNVLEDLFSNYPNSFHKLTNNNVEEAVQYFVEQRGIDMIAMVARNLNYFQQILFHSKVEKISYHTTVPFLILHE